MEKKLINSQNAREILGNISCSTFWRWKRRHNIQPLPGTQMYLVEDIHKILNLPPNVNKNETI